ncbi:MAG: hypothetical protein ACI92G_003321 [Candidatus Pelagisphaera sp.]|jgi:hypothetical protein
MDELDPVELALMPDELRIVCGQLIRDIVGEPIDVGSLISGDPMFLIRSASPTLFKSFVALIGEANPRQEFVVVSHEKDRILVKEIVTNPYSFHPYPVQGSYSLNTFSQAFPDFENANFGAKVFLDSSGVLSGLEHVIEIINWMQKGDAYVWSGVESTLLKLAPPKRREFSSDAAKEALQALAKWNATRFL